MSTAGVSRGLRSNFPSDLLDWAGHRAGGVRRLFYEGSGRPAGSVIRTNLLARLQEWAHGIAVSGDSTPTIVLLAGGPGNGKTEAIEFTVAQLDAELQLSGRLIANLQGQFSGDDGRPAPRLARVDVSGISAGAIPWEIQIVQDASAADSARPKLSPAELLVDDLEGLLTGSPSKIYLACVNRGVLDDALIAAVDQNRPVSQALLESTIRAVGMDSDATSCWPLVNFDRVAVWPMDAETLIGDLGEQNGLSPARQVIEIATEKAAWPQLGSCPAGTRCPFCISRERLGDAEHRDALLRILRWYELASGKRWSFRDLFSLTSFLLAGVRTTDRSAAKDPCEWAAYIIDQMNRSSSRSESLRLSAPFVLVASQYHQALFNSWPKQGIRNLRQDLSDLKLFDHPVLAGLYYFLTGARASYGPPTLEGQLQEMAELLDPATADPDLPVEISSRTTINFRDIDTRFSQSVGEGLRYIQKYRCLTSLEIDLLKKLEIADQRLGDSDVKKRRPAVAARVQTIVRNFACRIVRRSIGVKAGVTRDSDILRDYAEVIGGSLQLLHDAGKQVEALLNDKDRFVVTLNTTFGEPLPAAPRRVTLSTSKQKVRPKEHKNGTRPAPSVRFLNVGTTERGQAIALTYALYKSVRELRRGLLPSSLPRGVVALLDATRARLGGQIVRDEEVLEAGEIRIGLRPEAIVRDCGQFLVRTEDGQ